MEVFEEEKNAHKKVGGERRKERRENKWFPIPAAEFVNGLWILNRNIFQLSMFNEVQRICHHFHFAFLFNLSFFDGSFFVVARNSISTSLISVRRKFQLTTEKNDTAKCCVMWLRLRLRSRFVTWKYANIILQESKIQKGEKWTA